MIYGMVLFLIRIDVEFGRRVLYTIFGVKGRNEIIFRDEVLSYKIRVFFCTFLLVRDQGVYYGWSHLIF